MKTTTRRGRCLWRGKELPQLSESVIPYLASFEFDVLFAANLQTENSAFNSLLSALINSYSSDLIIYYPSIQLVESLSSVTAHQLLTYIVGDGFSEVVYLFDQCNNFLIYSNSRDSFSFWIVPRNKLTNKETKNWDAEFERHLEATGIGFGKEGRAYLRRLLDEAAQLGAGNRERFLPILRNLL